MSLPSALSDLASTDAWVGWRWVTLPNGKRDKPPFRTDFPDFHASTQNPRTWGTFGAACTALADGKVDGIGYVLRDDMRRVFIDMDKCRNPETGEIASWALRIVEEANSYTEITPSGCGLRIIGYGAHLGRQIHTAYKMPGGGTGEIFFRAPRFVTVTGNRLEGTPDNLADISDITTEMLMMSGKATTANNSGEPFTPSPEASAPMEDIAAALAVIPNPGDDVPYDDWVRIGLAVFAASGGSVEGREAWEQWSGKSSKYVAQECERVWQSFRRAPPKRIGFGTLYYQATSNDPFFIPPSWRAKATPFEEPAASGGTEEPKAKPKRGITLLRLEDVENMPPPTWVVEGLVPERSLVIPYGPPKVGKTFVVLSMGLHVAAGADWMGFKVNKGGVVYIAGEGVGGLSVRIRVMRAAYNIPANIPFWVIPKAVNFRDGRAVAELLEAIRAEVMDEPLALVVVDTLARAMPGVDENSAEEVGVVVAACDHLKAELGCTVMPIHHAGKDAERGLRGSSALGGAVDASLRVKDAGNGRVVVETEYQKEGEPAKPFILRMQHHPDGISGGSLVPLQDDAEAVQKKQAGRPRTANANLAVAALENTPSIEPPPGADVPAGVRICLESDWHKQMHAKWPAVDATLQGEERTKAAAKRRAAMQQARERAVAEGFVCTLSGYVWHTGKA